MSLYSDLLTDLTTAMKQQDQAKLPTLRLLKAACLQQQKTATGSGELSDEQMIQLLSSEAKKRRDAIDSFTSGGRSDLAATEAAELEIIQHYLPAQASDEAIEAVVREIVAGLPNAQLGAVMGQAMQRLKGQADGDRVRSVVTRVLQP